MEDDVLLFSMKINHYKIKDAKMPSANSKFIHSLKDHFSKKIFSF